MARRRRPRREPPNPLDFLRIRRAVRVGGGLDDVLDEYGFHSLDDARAWVEAAQVMWDQERPAGVQADLPPLPDGATEEWVEDLPIVWDTTW